MDSARLVPTGRSHLAAASLQEKAHSANVLAGKLSRT